jgi:hypothetical protein
MQEERDKLKLVKGVALVKTHLKGLPQEEDTWEPGCSALKHSRHGG